MCHESQKVNQSESPRKAHENIGTRFVLLEINVLSPVETIQTMVQRNEARDRH